jgi:hypothetical protein
MNRYIARRLALIFVVATIPAELVDAAEPTLQLCLDEAADGTPVYPTTSFPDSTKEVMLQVTLGKDHPFKKLAATWIAVDVGSAAQPNQVIGTSFLSAQNFERGLFPYRQSRPLPVGKYRVDVTGDDQPWKSAEFSVVASPAVTVAKPEDFIPLHQGQVWTYALVQEPGAGAKLDSDAKPDADGKVRATVTMTVAAEEDGGIRVDTRRDDVLAFKEWFQLDNRGLVSLKRQGGEATVVLDPPQLMVKWPLKSQRWDYTSHDGMYNQHYRMWGPLPIEWGGGEAAGYVVLVTQQIDSRHPRLTVERHYIPGVGMVSETAITAFGDQLLNRQDIVLQK